MYSFTLSLTLALDRSEWSKLGPGRFTPGKDHVPIVKEAGWVPGPVWTGAENLAPPHRNSIPGPFSITVIDTNLLNLHYFQIGLFREYHGLRLERPADDSSIFLDFNLSPCSECCMLLSG